MKKDVKFIGKAKITKQGQVTMPYEGRKDLNINLESEVYWYEVNNCLVVVKELANQKEILDKISRKKK
jgi:bifunctional DNA-binding transcriptional regulator/antitoxin component of YhaV-PrlF toxin-antitoxin module